MKTILFDVPKKVRKKIQLEDVKLPINRAPNVLGLIKNFAIENKMAITVGVQIIDSNGEEEIADKFIIKESNSSNLLLLLRESLFSEKYSEFPAQLKEEFLQEVETDLKVPIENSMQENVQESNKPSESNTEQLKQINHTSEPKKLKISPTQIFIILDIIAITGFLIFIGYQVLAIFVLVLSLIIISGFAILKQKSKDSTPILGGAQFAKKYSNSVDKQESLTDNALIIGTQINPKTNQMQKEDGSMSNEEIEKTVPQETAGQPDQSPEALSNQQEDEVDAAAQEEQESLDNLKSSVHEGMIWGAPIPNSDLPSNNSPESQIKMETTPNKNDSFIETTDAVSISEDSPSLPVLEHGNEAFPTLKAGNAETNHLFNLERLDKQIGLLIEQEFKEIRDKQAVVDQLEIKNHSDAMKARVSIEEIYQLQSAFEKKWTVA
ncbi:hypothetical protein EFE32_13000 [Lactococcus lactis subsp. lactis]|uniref:hypothetical protein n=1 Tax=Lactococcus lactis TaxID=1358 RepID=UPI00223B5413|nr:hypothetical protein [Lactococcus lactis]MCT0017689.1 hypothetical protein [Lactococcus lactis subsp. lactis]